MTTTTPPLTADSAVYARGPVKTFGAVRAVDGIDLDVHRGEVFGVLGPNGAGKTNHTAADARHPAPDGRR